MREETLTFKLLVLPSAKGRDVMHLVKMRPKSYPLDPVRRVKKNSSTLDTMGGNGGSNGGTGPSWASTHPQCTAAMLAGEAAAKGGLWHSGKPPFIEDLAFNATTHPSQDKKKK